MENISQVVKWKRDVISGAEEELQLLTCELCRLRAIVRKAANKPKEVEELLLMMNNVVYESEDTIDSCLTVAAKTNKLWHRRRLNTKPVNLAEELKFLIQNKVKPLLDLYAANVVQNDVVQSDTQQEERKPPTKLKQLNQVGFDDEVEILINHLMEDTEELDVISIIGQPHLGMTTLARRIFENPKIRYEFVIRIWVYVSREFRRKDVFLGILKQLTKRDMSSLSDRELGQTVHELLLKEGNFLLVLDDVWSVEDWNCVQEILPKTNGMCKVLITTRYNYIGWQGSYTATLRFLNMQESWELLQLQVFGSLECCPKELESIGICIARHCDGVALVIVVVGGILEGQWSTRKSMITIVNEWDTMKRYLDKYLFRDDYDQNIMMIINMGYAALPHDLRDCFLYFGVIPQDYEISAWTLTRLWIAEGFIQPKDYQSLEETAQEILIQLINRRLVMVCKTDPLGQVKTCRVAAEVHTFCISKAAPSEQNLFEEIKISRDGIFDPSGSNLQRHRRLCIHSHLSEFLSTDLNGPRVRSLLCFHEELSTLRPEYISAIANAFKLLRVMESRCINFTKFPMKFTRLIHLRYFTLSCDNLDVLPEPVAQLLNLQTLVIDTESPTLEVRANIWRMTELTHFKTKAAITLVVQEEGRDNATQNNLQTLTRLSPESCTDEVLNRVPNLKSLGIRGQLTTLIHIKCLRKLDGLEKLKLVNDLFYESTCGNRLRELPSLPPNLKRLSLSATYLNWEHMSILGKISTLEVLKLKNNAFTGVNWHFNDQGFEHLEFLLIAETDLVLWEVSTDSFPRLKHLVLKNCEELLYIPVGLTKSLEQLDIERLNEHAVASAKNIEEEKRATQGHVRFKLSIGIGCE